MLSFKNTHKESYILVMDTDTCVQKNPEGSGDDHHTQDRSWRETGSRVSLTLHHWEQRGA